MMKMDIERELTFSIRVLDIFIVLISDIKYQLSIGYQRVKDMVSAPFQLLWFVLVEACKSTMTKGKGIGQTTPLLVY